MSWACDGCFKLVHQILSLSGKLSKIAGIRNATYSLCVD